MDLINKNTDKRHTISKEKLKEAIEYIFRKKDKEREIKFIRGCKNHGPVYIYHNCGDEECTSCAYFKEEFLKQAKINNITEELNITGRGKVLLCENCYYNLGDVLTYNEINYKIRGIELQGYEEKPYKLAGLLVTELKEGLT